MKKGNRERMGLIKKINIIFSVIFIIGLCIIIPVFYKIEMTKARHEAMLKAEVIYRTALAVREYTAKNVAPFFLEKLNADKETFFPQAIPDYAVNGVFKLLQKNLKEYSYREVAINPRNLNNLPTEWEVSVIRYYRNHPEAKRKFYTRKKYENDFLYVTYPIRIYDKRCLRCHTDAKTAPKSLVKKYGPVNGMNWKFEEIVGAHLVSVPISLPNQKARESLLIIFMSILSVFILMFITLNIILSKWIVTPFKKLTTITEEISLGKNQHDNFPQAFSKEMKNLMSSIKRLKISMGKLMTSKINRKTKK